MVDLHAHTTASDGSYAPRDLVELAKKRGLSAVGVTDHDTLGGWDEAVAAGAELGVEIVPGVELSTAYPGGRFHILGYYIARESRLGDELRELQRERANRNDIIIENLTRLGVPVTWEAVRSYAGPDGVIGRPHFARALMDAGHVSSTQEAFDRFLADGAPAYATKKVLTPAQAIALIHEAGGVAIWAHPTRSKDVSHTHLEARLRDLLEAGLDGLETYYAAYTPEEQAWCEQMARKYGILGTGGSDFHGVSKPDIHLGRVRDGVGVPVGVLDALKAKRHRAVASQEAVPALENTE